MKNQQLTYISLFSSAGIGCYGFTQAGFDCIASVEKQERRMAIQRLNHKCSIEEGYIVGDFSAPETQTQLERVVKSYFASHPKSDLDVLIATPPCQGMSVANHKKHDAQKELNRNSLVVSSIAAVQQLKPNCFVFENVPAFMKTICLDSDGKLKAIGQAIDEHLGADYLIYSTVLNFKDYGSASSRTRTLVIGTKRNLQCAIMPYELLPSAAQAPTLRQLIGDLPPLQHMGDFAPNDFFHHFRAYDPRMMSWIAPLHEGQNAFENEDPLLRPHRIEKDGTIVFNKAAQSDKYKRQYWDRVAPCVHTRNDILSSQNTIHPRDNRVFSIRELMRMMTVPAEFRWTEQSLEELNALEPKHKEELIRSIAPNIRQCLGEAVPTAIFYQIAKKIFRALTRTHYSVKNLKQIIQNFDLNARAKLHTFVQMAVKDDQEKAWISATQRRRGTVTKVNNSHLSSQGLLPLEYQILMANKEEQEDTEQTYTNEQPLESPELVELALQLGFNDLSLLIELANTQRESSAAFYTSPSCCYEVVQNLPDYPKDATLRILEPSGGVGNFLPSLIYRYRHVHELQIDVVDTNANSLEYLQLLLNKIDLSANIHIRLINDDFLLHDFAQTYDLVIGNPPFGKIIKDKDTLALYKERSAFAHDTSNIFAFFLERALKLGKTVSMIVPKSLLSAPEYRALRQELAQKHVSSIIDFGESAFPSVKIETIDVCIECNIRPEKQDALQTKIYSHITHECHSLEQSYIMDQHFPCWLLYRNGFFDKIARSLQLGIFKVYRDRYITKKLTKAQGAIRVLKSRNIGDNQIINIPHYDTYIDQIEHLKVAKFVNSPNCILVPNLSYQPRACFLPPNSITDGSVAILQPISPELTITKEDLSFFAGEQFRRFYMIARNLGSRSLNIDNSSVYFFGKRLAN